MVVKEKDKVRVEYEGTLESGELFDSTALHGGEPLEFIVGVGMMISGFDKALIGMENGQEKEIFLNSEEAYGDSRPEYIQKVPRDKFPSDIEEGLQIGINTPMGQVPATIKSIGEDFVELDMNHPLAGKNLKFKIKLVDSEDGPFELPVHSHEHGDACSCEGESCSEEGCDCEDDCDCGDECSCDDSDDNCDCSDGKCNCK